MLWAPAARARPRVELTEMAKVKDRLSVRATANRAVD